VLRYRAITKDGFPTPDVDLKAGKETCQTGKALNVMQMPGLGVEIRDPK
jgi:hypothetical protein